MPVPTVSDGTDVFVNMIDTKYGAGTASVVTFHELDGKSVLYGNSLFYTLAYEAVVEFPEGIKADFEYKSNDDRFFFRVSTVPRIVDREKLVFAGKGWITFSLTPEGWHAPDGNTY